MQNLICTLYGWKEKRLRFNSAFFDFLDQLKKSEHWSAEDISSYKSKKLAKILSLAITHTPYYANRYSHLNAAQITSDSLSDFSILMKSDLREHTESLISNNINKHSLIEVHTSGTTGTALTLFKEPSLVARQWAVWFRHRNRFQCAPDELHVNFTGKQVVPTEQSKPPYWRFNKPMNQYLLNMQHISPEKIADIVAFLNSISPKFYSGYPSIIAEVARLALAHNLPLKESSRPKFVFSGAENTLNYQKSAIEEWTGALVTDQYGLTEGNCNLSRCEYGNYHEDFEFCHIECADPEYLPDGRKKGRLIGTALHNFAMPLIRYDTGDIAIWKPESYECPCGRKSAVIESIEGRIDDAVILPDGRKIMRFDYLFKDTESIDEAQVCQFKQGEVVIKIVANSKHDIQVESRLKEDFKEWYCKETIVKIQQVDSIEKSATGKFRAVKSYL